LFFSKSLFFTDLLEVSLSISNLAFYGFDLLLVDINVLTQQVNLLGIDLWTLYTLNTISLTSFNWLTCFSFILFCLSFLKFSLLLSELGLELGLGGSELCECRNDFISILVEFSVLSLLLSLGFVGLDFSNSFFVVSLFSFLVFGILFSDLFLEISELKFEISQLFCHCVSLVIISSKTN
jgi:hypothetical protein